jgi:exonuclease III
MSSPRGISDGSNNNSDEVNRNGDDIGDSEGLAIGQPADNGSEDYGVKLESENEGEKVVIGIGSWNVNGLGEYKQRGLLEYIASKELAVCAVCETHMWNSEQEVQWEKQLAELDSYVWYGRLGRHESGIGRGSGGVGMLVKKEWQSHVTVMQECEHDCLMFIRVAVPGAPFVMFFGVAYMVPIGSKRYGENQQLLDELEERVSSYQPQGLVCVMGDFNVHIGHYPSTILTDVGQMQEDMEYESDMKLSDASGVTLDRRSTDTVGIDGFDDVQQSGVDFVERMDSIEMIVTNGLWVIGDGTAAAATMVNSNSVIDYILIDAAHIACMHSVKVDEYDVVNVHSDHHMVVAALEYSEDERRSGDSQSVPSSQSVSQTSLVISTQRFNTRAQGRNDYYKEYEQQCTLVLAEWMKEWKQREAVGEDIDIEEIWYHFRTTVSAVAGDTIGVKQIDGTDASKASHHHVRRPGDHLLHQWRSRQHDIICAQRRVRLTDPARYANLCVEFRLNRRCIQNHIRKAVREKELEEIKKAESLRPWQMKEHWKQLKKVGNMQQQAASVPAACIKSDGNVVSEVGAVRDEWHRQWSKLATQLSVDGRFDQQHEVMVQRQVEECIEAEDEVRVAGSEELNHAIDADEVAAAVKRLQNGKAAGSDGMVAEILKNGGDEMLASLLLLCQLVWKKGEVPMDWLRGVIAPIHKDGDTRMPLNYRPITLLSIVGKVYTTILYARLMSYCEQQNIIVAEQGGFRPKRGCTEQLFTLTELIKMRRSQGKRTYCCFIDIKKAYDTVWHVGLKSKLLGAGIHGAMYRSICSLYQCCESTIRLGGQLEYTDFFSIETGVRQGCILSPLLYSIFINDLVKELRKLNAGIGIGDKQLCVLLYADDIVLMAEDMQRLQRLMKGVHDYSVKWRFEVNPSKCGLMRFNLMSDGTRLPDHEHRMTIGAQVIQWVSEYKYLGVEMQHAGAPFRSFRKRMEVKATRVMHMIAACGLYSGKLSVELACQLYKALMRPLLEYAAEITSLTEWKQAESMQMKMAKRILQCPIRTSNTAVRGELGWMTMEARYLIARLNLWAKMQMMTEDSPARVVYDASAEYAASNDRGDAGIPVVAAADVWQLMRVKSTNRGMTLWCEQIKADLYQLGMDAEWRAGREAFRLKWNVSGAWKMNVKQTVMQREKANWYHAVEQHEELWLYKMLKPSAKMSLSMYLTVPHGGWNDRVKEGRRVLTKLRCAVTEFRCYIGEWKGEWYAQRVCEICETKPIQPIEDEKHFLLYCDYYHSDRVKLFSDLNQIIWMAGVKSRNSAVMLQFDIMQATDMDRMLILCGGEYQFPFNISKTVRQQFMTRIMTEMHGWYERRNKKVAEMK